ncbi:hypothetical protein, partial [Staphylococcus saprophyticus]
SFILYPFCVLFFKFVITVVLICYPYYYMGRSEMNMPEMNMEQMQQMQQMMMEHMETTKQIKQKLGYLSPVKYRELAA